MGGEPPNEQDAGARPEPRAQSRFGGYRVAPQSPNEALQPEAAPPPPPLPPSRRRPILSAVSGFMSFLLLAAVVAMVGLIWSEQRMREAGPLAADKVLYIAPGADLPEIISELEREGVIDSPFALNFALLAEGKRSKVKAGEYLFKQGASLRDVMDTLVSGKQILHAISIPEGLTTVQIIDRLRESDVLAGDIKDLPKEGSLMPDTYKVARGDSRAGLVRKMQEDQKKFLEQVWARRAPNLPLHSPYELVTLASIVEKETGKADERPRVASVFLNRLTKRMRLQSDPTIVYGLVGGKGTLGRGITRGELEKPTPYNTYTIDGLPPGPIANPGRAAIEAVANPSRTQDLYFVADGTGGHVFAETLDQHSRNVQRWRLIEKDARDKAVAPDVDKAAPAPAPAGGPAPGGAPRGQRGDLDAPGSVYGALPASLDAAGAAAGPSMASAYGAQSITIARSTPLAEAAKPSRTGQSRAPGAGEAGLMPANAFAFGPGLDDLGISLKGPAGAALLDGPVTAADDGAAAAPGAAAITQALARAPADPVAPAAPTATGPAPDRIASAVLQYEGRARAPVYDVSEGTALDPLRDKTYDLNSAKTVPSLKQMTLPN